MTPAPTPLRLLAGITLVSAFALAATAQTAEPPKPSTEAAPTQAPGAPPTGQGRPYTGPRWPTSVHIFPLSGTTTLQQQNEILTAVRNINDPRVRIMLVPSQNTILFSGTDDQVALAQKMIDALDKPSKAYRLTYTLIDLDGTKRVGDQHYAMVLASGQRTVLKQGNKIPVITGAYLKEINAPQTQVTYLDIGMSFDATLDDATNSLRLKTKVEQSSVLEDRSGTVAQDPVVRQSVFEGTAMLKPGKPLTIGTLDIAGTTRRIEIQVTAELIP